MINGDIPELTPDLEVENIGAPKSVALQDGKWNAAALGFAKKCGISQDELGFKEIKGKEVLYHKSVIKGKLVSDLLPAMIEKFILSLNFGKSMRWGNGEYEFIRPIRSLISILGEKSLDFEIFGVKSKKAFYPHRNFGYDMIDFSSIDEYFELVRKNGIILSATQRKEKILNEFKTIETKNNLKIELDFDLLDEVVAITEYPTALLGSFEIGRAHV